MGERDGELNSTIFSYSHIKGKIKMTEIKFLTLFIFLSPLFYFFLANKQKIQKLLPSPHPYP